MSDASPIFRTGAMRRWLKRGAAALVSLLVLLLVLALLFAAALDSGRLKGAALELLQTRSGRPLRVDGSLRIHLLARRPRISAEGVHIGNPPWTAAGSTADIGKLTLVLDDPWRGHGLALERIELEAATLHLSRDAAGHANWQGANPDVSLGKGLPLIHSLSMPAAHVLLNDALKHRQFDGSVSVFELPPAGASASAAPALRIEGKGLLNGKQASLEVTGDPLRDVTADSPYRFSFEEHSDGSRLSATGFLLQPFNMHLFDAAFTAAGPDLKDIFYLTGTHLLDTGDYTLSGKLARRGDTSAFTDLAIVSGSSTVRGHVSVETKGGRLKIEGELAAPQLRLEDIGARAAGRAPQRTANEPLFSTATPDPGALRRNTASLKLTVARMSAGPLLLDRVAATLRWGDGVLTLAPADAGLLGGTMTAQLKIDARGDIPAVALEMDIKGAQLGDISHKGGTPLIEGPLALRLRLNGRGRSLHEAAASAAGTVSATMRSGMLRDSVAELSGLDLRGLGLLLTKSGKQAGIRCGIASFRAQGGTFTAQNLLIDTDAVLITGAGSIDLDTESLDLLLRGRPKSLRILRLAAPLQIRGTLAHPSFGVQAHAARLQLIDRGKTASVDCAALLPPMAAAGL